MKYSEIIALEDYFQPVYDIEKERGTLWKQFIPNEKFYDVLDSVLNSLISDRPDIRKSIWLQGTYGTGKSHATSVVKHLLFDNNDNIDNFKIDTPQLKHKLESFRKGKKVFPVIIKGTSYITNNRTFSLAIEKSVKNALKSKGIKIGTKTEFERMIQTLEDHDAIWENIYKNSELEVYGSKQDVIDKLKRHDVHILTKIEERLAEKTNLAFIPDNIREWLVGISKKLKEEGIADYLMIYWDEFTGMFQLPKSSLVTTELENIAELSKDEDVFLFVVSHRTPTQLDISKEELEKIKDRFKVLDYSMEPITTYHIINGTIHKINEEKWEKIKNKYTGPINQVIKEINITETTNVEKSLQNLFPIHPYTAYLATFIARNIGSTERSIFSFLYDDEKGFKKFIEEFPVDERSIFLTSDYLWDFFYVDFDRFGTEKVNSVLERYKTYHEILNKKGAEFLSVFKGILILNIIYRVAELSEASLVTPSNKNIRNMFSGSLDENIIDEILDFIDAQQIVAKTPNNLYLLTSSGLSQQEIESEKIKLKPNYQKIEDILNVNQKKDIKNAIEASVNREIEFLLLDNSYHENIIRNKLDKAFENNHKINLCLFLGRNKQESNRLKEKLPNISQDDDLKNIIFLISDVELSDKEFGRFIDFQARAIVANRHNYTDDMKDNESFARKTIDGWVNQIKSRIVHWILKGDDGSILMTHLYEKINKDFSKEIFSYGLENLEGTTKNINIWKKKKAKASLEIFLNADIRNHIEEKTQGGPENYLRKIIKDNKEEYVIDTNLNFKEGIPDDHPLKSMQIKLREKFENRKDRGTFNLGEDTLFLSKPPYGLYKNMVNMAAMGFIMRDYVGKLFEAGTGIPIQKENMRNKILDLFDFWEQQTKNKRAKLEVRFGSEDEENLIELLSSIFNLTDIESLNNARWGVRKWVKDLSFPIWVFKLSERNNEKSKIALDCIFNLIQSIDKELNLKKISESLENIEMVKIELNSIFKDDPQILFEKWIETIGVDVSKKDYDEIISYVHKNMQEEVSSWTEDKTREMIKDWKLKKLVQEKKESLEKHGETPEIEANPEPSEEHNEIPEIEANPEPPEKAKIKDVKFDVKKSIQECKEVELKRIIINIIDERPDILEIFKKYLLD
jgi:hypothetical protein